MTTTDRAIIPDEIHEGPDAIRATLQATRPGASEAAALLAGRDVRRVFVIGNGTSYHSALAATALYRRHAAPDDPVVLPLTAADFRTYRPALGSRDAVVAISASGEFPDVIGALDDVRGTVPTIGIGHVAGSSMTRSADTVVLSAGGPSRVPVMTKTFSATLVAAELTLLALLGDGVLDRVSAEIGRAADDAAATIRGAEAVMDDAVDFVARYQHIFVVGAGMAHIAALEAALKLKEIALIHAEGGETWEMTSGAATMLGPDSLVIGLAVPGKGCAATEDFLRHAAEWGSATLEVAARRTNEGSLLVELPADSMEDHAPLSAVPAVALIAFGTASSRGIDPDRPGWVRRYHAQGLDHVIGAKEQA